MPFYSLKWRYAYCWQRDCRLSTANHAVPDESTPGRLRTRDPRVESPRSGRASCRTPGAAQARHRNTFRQPGSVRDVPSGLRRGFPLLMSTAVAFIEYLLDRYSTASASFLDNVVLCAGKPRRYGLPCPSERPCRNRRRCFSLSSRYPSSSAASRHFS